VPNCKSFLVTEAERKHVRRRARFQQHENARCLFFFPLQGKAPKEAHAILRKTFGEHAPSYATVKNWAAQFKRGDFFTYDAPRPGRPKTVTIPEIIDQIHELILDDRLISAKSIAEQLGISRERVGSIIHKYLDTQKLSTKWVPKCLNADQKRQRCQSSEKLLEFFRRDPNDFLSRLLTIDESWLYYYYPDTKQQSMEWRHSGSPRPKKFQVQKSAGKFLASIFGDQDGILIDYLPKGQTINTEYYSSLLVQLKGILKEKRHGKVANGVLLLHDNAPANRAFVTQKKLAYLGFQRLDHPPHSPDMAPSDYNLFPGLKKQLKGRHFSSDAEVIAAAETWLDGPSQFSFLSGLQKIEQRAKKCTELRGEHVEYIPSLVAVACFLPDGAKDLSAPLVQLAMLL